MNECVFLGTKRCQNNVLSSTFSSSFRMTIKSPQKFYEVLIRGYWVWVYSYWILNVKRAPEVSSLFYFEMLFRSHPTKNILFMQYNLQNQFLMIIFVFILKLDACYCLNFLHRLNSSFRNRFMNKYPTVITVVRRFIRTGNLSRNCLPLVAYSVHSDPN